MAWVEVFAAFVVCHLAGDYLLQTDWQARHKRAGLGRDPVARRALFSHVTSYTLAFVPALIWMASDIGANVIWVAALIFFPHLIQDDGRLLTSYMQLFKGGEVADNTSVAAAVDQSFHFITLFGIALLAAAVS
jgi:Protein of unknown function (DUF3307)